MKINHLIIENFRAIERLDLDCSRSVNAFIGDNGAGKSTVLDAIQLLNSWLIVRLYNDKARGKSILKEDVRTGSNFCFLFIEVEHNGMIGKWSLLRGTPPIDSVERRTDLKYLHSLVQQITSNNEDIFYFLSYYGINRNISSISIAKGLFGKKEVSASASWKAFFNWYYERENEENRMKARFNMQYHDESLDAIRECLKEVFPEYKNLHIKDRPTRFVIEKKGQEINFDRLSDGEKCYITLVLDIARRLSLHNDGIKPILDCEQVILIDEIDLHLHPSWQLQVVSNLKHKFPNCQFFITSHSPLVLSSLGEMDELTVLRDGKKLELSDIPYGDNGDYILKRFFGLSSVRNPKVQAEIDFISAELSKEKADLNEIERKLDALKEKGVMFEESVKMRLQLAQKKKKAHEKN